MARPRVNKSARKGQGTSFGKKSDAEKKFKKRSRISRPYARDSEQPSRPDGKDDRYGSSFRTSAEGQPRFSKPFRPDGDPEKKTFRKSDGSFRDRDYGKGDSNSYRKGEPKYNTKKSFGKMDNPSFGASADRPNRYSNSKGKTGDIAKPSLKSGDFSKPFRPFRTNADAGGSPDKKRPDRKSFVQSRVINSGDFAKPVYREESKKSDGLIRLNKYIANSGMGSRREADKIIEMGLISVNGVTVAQLGTKVKPGDVVRYEDRILKAEKPIYILLNKPKGFITTTDDPQERNTVMGLVAGACKERIYPVGRLDRNTTGLLLITNDGDLTDKLTHPSYKAKKVYKVELDKPLTKNDFEKIVDGVHLEEGRAMVDDLAIISDDHKTIGVEIHIGWNRVVRRIFESQGYEVMKLDRSVYAGLDKKDLSRGQWRFLKPEEVVMLKHFK